MKAPFVYFGGKSAIASDVWAALSCWIGSGLTRPRGIPHISDGGKGIHAVGAIPHVGNGGKGIHAIGKRPHLSHGGMDEYADVREPYNTNIYKWFRQLSERLRHVRVVCGDWKQVCGGNWQDKIGVCGIFFDPPYGDVGRDKTLYAQESLTVAAEVSAWAVKRGHLPSYRIVVCGYEGEHQCLVDAGWRVQAWKATGGYSNVGADDSPDANRHRERLFYSPHCLQQLALFPEDI